MNVYAAPRYPHMLHGGDYNPDQWLKYPEVLEQDVLLMKKANINCVSLGIFSWAKLEPEDGVYDFAWMDAIIDRLYQNGIYTILATPSGARPYWLSHKYPETSRVDVNGLHHSPNTRHNHCYTSPVMIAKTRAIDEALARHYQNHPGIIMWHISNEFNGECFCDRCKQAFREYLKEKYHTLDALNDAWWGGFWSHTYTEWEQIMPPMAGTERGTHGLNLDWKRFVTKKTVDFVRMEREAVKKYTPDIPVTINMMQHYEQLDYYKFSDVIDVASWDAYPQFDYPKMGRNADTALRFAMWHDVIRCMKKGKPFLMMESCPSATNWQDVSKLKRPGILKLASTQAIAHGSDSVQYFQIRKGRGGSEKFHGAVIDHYGKADTRVFRDVTEVGAMLQNIDRICGSTVAAKALMIYDVENAWAIEDACGPRNIGMHYLDTVIEHYKPFWRAGVPVDFTDCDGSLSGYALVIAPMLYMTRAGIADKMKEYVANGGTLVLTYHSGIVDENDLCYLGGWPGELMELAGLRSEEIDALYDGEYNGVVMEQGNALGMQGSYRSSELMDQIIPTTATVLGRYERDFYAKNPCLTVNNYGNGKVYYIASKNEERFLSDFYRTLRKDCGITGVWEDKLPDEVAVGTREDAAYCYDILQNYGKACEIALPKGCFSLESGEALQDKLSLAENAVAFIYRKK